MIIQLGKYNLHFQFAPIFGISLGYIFYTPLHEPDIDEIDEEDDYSRHQLMFLIFALIVTVWKS